MRASLLSSSILALLFVTASRASGQEIDSSIFYRLTARHSGKCLSVAGGMSGLRNGDPLIQ
jgi:hypothetical protein